MFMRDLTRGWRSVPRKAVSRESRANHSIHGLATFLLCVARGGPDAVFGAHFERGTCERKD